MTKLPIRHIRGSNSLPDLIKYLKVHIMYVTLLNIVLTIRVAYQEEDL